MYYLPDDCENRKLWVVKSWIVCFSYSIVIGTIFDPIYLCKFVNGLPQNKDP